MQTFQIEKQWDGKPNGHDAITLTLTSAADGLDLFVTSPFFNDPGNPGGTSGDPFPKLWEYEVFEAFFLSDDDKYLEVELCPHGQHLVLLLDGERNCFKDKLSLEFTATINNETETWEGKAHIPTAYFPPRVSKFNAYYIKGSGGNRMYEALYPAAEGQLKEPDFHALQFFEPLDLPGLCNNGESNLWATRQGECNKP